jgi:hypothetical protein
MNTLQDLSAQLESLHASALALRSLMEDLEPSAALSEQRWFVGLHLARQLTEASDEACSDSSWAERSCSVFMWLPSETVREAPCRGPGR